MSKRLRAVSCCCTSPLILKRRVSTISGLVKTSDESGAYGSSLSSYQMGFLFGFPHIVGVSCGECSRPLSTTKDYETYS